MRYAYRCSLGRIGVVRRARMDLSVRYWERKGRPVPPPDEVKRRALRHYLRHYGLRTFVETGTFRGDTSAEMEPYVDRVITIELAPDLAARARERFAASTNVRVLEGDSGKVLPELLPDLDAPALFWLDGHYSGGITARGDEDTPVRAELAAILEHDLAGHVILIDDAREFRGGAYPTIEEVIDIVRAHRADYSVEVREDIIRVTPGQCA